MIKGHFWILHLYSCLRFDDLEILYSKLRKCGLELRSSNSWVDCFEIKKSAETEYKIVPANIPIDSINIEHWKLKIKNNRYYIFEYDVQCTEKEIYNDIANKNNSYFPDVAFLFAFPICTYYFVQKFNIFKQSVLPEWMNYLFVTSIFSIYLGHFSALLISRFQAKHYTNGKKKINKSDGKFFLRVAISCIINILQIVFILIVFFGIMKV